MKQATVIGYITLAFIVLLVASIEDAVAQQADEVARRCLAEAREIMGREEIKQLGEGDQKRVNEYCRQGDVNSATRYLMRIGAYKRCTRDLDAHIESNNLDVANDVHDRARMQCRQDDFRKAIEVVDGAPIKVPASPAEIISFVASTSKVKKGSSVTLSWRTANADMVMLGRHGTDDFKNVQTSGAQSFSPDKTTTYVLMVGQSTKGPTTMKSKTLQVAVTAEPMRPCSIRGELDGKWRQQIQERFEGPISTWTVDVFIYVAGSDEPFDKASVSSSGRYHFKGLRAGKEYTVKPSWASSPRKGKVSCTPGKTHEGPRFEITGGPLID